MENLEKNSGVDSHSISSSLKENNDVDYALKMLNIHKSFNNGAIKANIGINLLVKKNTIHAIIGENGAGKSTLMSILFGMYEQDVGEIFINNNLVKFKSSKDAAKYKIGMVHQHFKLVDNFTIFDNVILGNETTTKFGLIEKKITKKHLKDLIDKYEFNLNVDQKISQLTVGKQQKVEILKVLYQESEIMIFDEPTAILSDSEIKSFLSIVEQFKKDGKTIIIITHKLHEVKQIADEATIIRKGKFIDLVDIKKTSIEKLAELMVGRKVTPSINNLSIENNEVILEVKDLNLKDKQIFSDEWFSEKTSQITNKVFEIKNKILNKKSKNENLDLNDNTKNSLINFKIKAGEIYAIAGVEGNGQSKLIEIISGLIFSKPKTVIFCNQDISQKNIATRIKLGLSFVPEDRHKHGLVLDQSVRMNIVNNQINNSNFSFLGFIKNHEIKMYSQKAIEKYDVRGSANGVLNARGLSGGNQQKVIIARELEKNHKLIILAQPTRGLDVGAIQYIHNQIIEEKKKGNAILLVSYELDEILALADKIAVMSKNKIIKEGTRKEMTREYIGQLLAGEVL